jgi:hypothetical protein
MILLHTRSQLQCFAAAARQARIIHDGGPAWVCARRWDGSLMASEPAGHGHMDECGAACGICQPSRNGRVAAAIISHPMHAAKCCLL